MNRHIKRFIKSWGPVIIIVLLIRAFFVEAFRVPTGSMDETIIAGDMLLVNRFIYGIKLPFTSKAIISVKEPERGEIVVFRYPLDPDYPQPFGRYVRILFPKFLPFLPLYWDKEKHWFKWSTPRNFVKRCIATARDTVEIRNKQLYINGKIQYEPYVLHKDPYVYPGLNIEEGYQARWESREFADNPSIGGRVRDNFGPVVIPEGHIFMMGDNRDNSFDSRFWGPLKLEYVKGEPMVFYFSIGPRGLKWNRIGKIIR